MSRWAGAWPDLVFREATRLNNAQARWPSDLRFSGSRRFYLSKTHFVFVRPDPRDTGVFPSVWLYREEVVSSNEVAAIHVAVLNTSFMQFTNAIVGIVGPERLPSDMARLIHRLRAVSAWIERAVVAARRAHDAQLRSRRQQRAIAFLDALLAEADLTFEFGAAKDEIPTSRLQTVTLGPAPHLQTVVHGLPVVPPVVKTPSCYCKGGGATWHVRGALPTCEGWG